MPLEVLVLSSLNLIAQSALNFPPDREEIVTSISLPSLIVFLLYSLETLRRHLLLVYSS